MVGHRILLRGLGPLSSDGAPLLLRRTDQELIPVLLAQLQAGGELAPVAATRAADRNADRSAGGTLRLFQPVQRTFYVALFEAVCELPGYPRVDPEAVESAGLVVRRLRPGRRVQGWLAQQSTVRGWLDLEPGDPAGDPAADPDPQRRRRLSSGNAVVDNALAVRQLLANPLAEATTPLFVAPPAVCAALGKTILYGLVPVTSAEFSEQPAANAASPAATSPEYAQLVDRHLPGLLRAGKRPLALAGRTLTHADALAATDDLRTFTATLRQITVELDAFGSRPESQALYAELNRTLLTLPGGNQQRMGDFLAQAAAVLVAGQPGQVTLPAEWPEIDPAQAQRISQLVVGSISSRVVAEELGEQRFAQPNAVYHLRGFVRMVREPNCPPELTWSEPSEPYQIAPWYEFADTGLPLPKIELPDPFDRDALRKLKPNVSFRVPEKLFDLMNSMDPGKVMDGKGADVKDKFGLDWICSFSLPIITICAFIVLNLFLSLFDLFFQWLLLIKLCIPVPKRS